MMHKGYSSDLISRRVLTALSSKALITTPARPSEIAYRQTFRAMQPLEKGKGKISQKRFAF